MFLGMVIYDNEFETIKENKIWIKDEIEPQQIDHWTRHFQNLRTLWVPQIFYYLFQTYFFCGRGYRTMVSVLHKELEYKVEKLKYKMSEVIELRIKNKSELPVGE